MPLGGSEMAETVLTHVGKLAQQLSLEMVLLRVIRMAPQSYGGHEGMPMDTAEIEQSLENKAKEYLTTVETENTAKGMTCRTKVMHRVPWDKIVAFAGNANDMMVAISTHGRSGIPRLVLGSVANTVIRSLESSVLVVRPL